MGLGLVDPFKTHIASDRAPICTLQIFLVFDGNRSDVISELPDLSAWTIVSAGTDIYTQNVKNMPKLIIDLALRTVATFTARNRIDLPMKPVICLSLFCSVLNRTPRPARGGHPDPLTQGGLLGGCWEGGSCWRAPPAPGAGSRPGN